MGPRGPTGPAGAPGTIVTVLGPTGLVAMGDANYPYSVSGFNFYRLGNIVRFSSNGINGNIMVGVGPVVFPGLVPVGFRPLTTNLYYAIHTLDLLSAAPFIGSIRIDTNGDVSIYRSGTNGNWSVIQIPRIDPFDIGWLAS